MKIGAIIFVEPNSVVCPKCGSSKHLEIFRVLTVTEIYSKIPQGFAISSSERNEAMSGAVRCKKCKQYVMCTDELIQRYEKENKK